MKNIIKLIRAFILKITGLEKLMQISDQLKWLQDYHFHFTDVTKAVPAQGIVLLQQQALAKLLEIFDLICKKYQLSYWLGAGNLLGIVRHNGNAVPWDDDIDVYMLRPDFEKAVKLLPELFKNTDFIIFFRGWSLKFMKYNDTPISFDIFPIDQYFKKISTDKEKKDIIKKTYKIKSISRKEYVKASGYTEATFYKSIWYGNVKNNSSKLLKLLDKAKLNWDKIVMEGNQPAANGHLLVGYERAGWSSKQYSWNYDWIFPLKRMKYMNTETNIPNNPDLYLYSQYGDIWTLPLKFGVHPHAKNTLSIDAINSLQDLISNLNALEFINILYNNTLYDK